jgi:hypothetical protein
MRSKTSQDEELAQMSLSQIDTFIDRLIKEQSIERIMHDRLEARRLTRIIRESGLLTEFS